MGKNHKIIICCEINCPLFPCQEQSDHCFKETMKLEAVNPLSPENIHVATVTRVKGQYVWLSLEGKLKQTEELFISAVTFSL